MANSSDDILMWQIFCRFLESFPWLGCNFIIFGGNSHTGYWSAPLLNRLGLATRGTCVFIFLLSLCNVSKPLECALKFWHLACFILKIWDNFPKTNRRTIELKQNINMVIILLEKISTLYNYVTYSATLDYYVLLCYQCYGIWWYIWYRVTKII